MGNQQFKSEGDIKKAARKFLKTRFPDIWTYWPVQTGLGRHGIPDLLMCIGGNFVAVEFKYDGNEPTGRQDYELEQIWKSGGCTLVIDELNYWFFEIVVANIYAGGHVYMKLNERKYTLENGRRIGTIYSGEIDKPIPRGTPWLALDEPDGQPITTRQKRHSWTKGTSERT